MDLQDETNGSFLITSADQERFWVPDYHAKQLKIFNPRNRYVQLQCNDKSDYKLFSTVMDDIKEGTITPSCFKTHYCHQISHSMMPFSKWAKFDLNLSDNEENRVAKILMPMARELQAESMQPLFLSLLFTKNHKEMFSSLLLPQQEQAFEAAMNTVCRMYTSRNEKIHNISAQCNHAQQKKVTNESRTILATICDQQKYIFVTDKVRNMEIRIPIAGKSITNIALSGDDSRLIYIKNFGNSHTKSFTLFVWETESWQLLVEKHFLDAGNVHALCLNHDGTRAVMSVQTSPIFSERDPSAPRHANHIVDITNAEILDSIPIKNIAARMYWLPTEEFVTSFHKGHSWCFEKWSPSNGSGSKHMVLELDFAQKVLLYGLHERIQATMRHQEPTESFVCPLMTGYVSDFVSKSLPKTLREWAQEIQEEYQFQ